MFNLMPRDTVFFDLFEGLATHAVSCARHLHMITQSFPNIQTEVARIRQKEHEADILAHQALERLDRTFITPFDREDIHALVGELDSIIDNINALAKRFGHYHITSMETGFVKQTEILLQATVALSEAVHRLRKSRKLSDLQEKLIEVHRLENVGDDNHLVSLSRLFEGQPDPLYVMKWREFYLFLEAAIDGCEDVTNVLERIVLKNG
jgi:uncharacterized protein Yka (UPF0111/DUF47 family)